MQRFRNFNSGEKIVRKKTGPSHQYHKLRFEDATWDYGEDDGEDFDSTTKSPKNTPT